MLTFTAIMIHGYHVGVEDQDVYLAAAKKWLDPSLYPVNSEFFMEQMKASAFIPALAWSARLLTMPWALFLWHAGSLFLLLLGCWRIVEILFDSPAARWSGVVLVAVMLTLPIAGTALYPVDPYLHPRTPAAAGILLSVAAGLERRFVRVAGWMAFAIAMHPLMGLFGISVLIFLCFPFSSPAALAAFAWLDRPSPAWNEAAMARTYYFPLHWQWYEWLGMLAPLAILWWLSRGSAKRASPKLQHICRRLVWFAVFQTAVAMLATVPAGVTELPALQPMRWLHIFYFFFLLVAGGLMGEYILRNRPAVWLIIFGALAAIMFGGQRLTYASSNHLDWPGRPLANKWGQAFLWIQANTSRGDLFALDPKYMDASGEDSYGFRALAERSMLAEDQKDPGAATVFPELLPKWYEQVTATRGIANFPIERLVELHRQFGVQWTVVPANATLPLSCPFRNAAAQVCRIE